MEKKLKHLEFIQGVINRLAANSFQMKGWSVVLVAAILVLVAREGRLDAALIALVPILVFWGLDGYFLWQERLYRALYDHVRTQRRPASTSPCMRVGGTTGSRNLARHRPLPNLALLLLGAGCHYRHRLGRRLARGGMLCVLHSPDDPGRETS